MRREDKGKEKTETLEVEVGAEVAEALKEIYEILDLEISYEEYLRDIFETGVLAYQCRFSSESIEAVDRKHQEQLKAVAGE
jgi:hypothetical protein